MAKSYKGTWNYKDPVTITERDLAMNRAMIMAKLFELEHFEKIVNAINMPNAAAKEAAFLAACPADITPEQKKWLWNYLTHYDPANNWVGTGW